MPQLLRGTSLYGVEAPQFEFVRPTQLEVVHIPESPLPLNSPEMFHKNPFRYNKPLPAGEVVREIIYDQDWFYLQLTKRLEKRIGKSPEKSRPTEKLTRNKSNLFKMARLQPLRIADQTVIFDETERLNSPAAVVTGSMMVDYVAKSFHPRSPHFDSQHSILDLTHVSSL